VNQGYFIMDLGTPSVTTNDETLSAGTSRTMWDTGAGISSAEFAVVATAAEVQTALRTITGWEGVTVELWGNYKASLTLTTNHQFKVTFAAGYDDLGKSPTFKTLGTADGAYATAVPADIEGRLYDQRFSNSIWLGKTTGYAQLSTASAGDPSVTTGTFKFAALSTAAAPIELLPENGDVWMISDYNFGTGNGAGAPHNGKAHETNGVPTHQVNFQQAKDADAIIITHGDGENFAYLHEGATSVQTSDYFAVGSTVEVLGTTYDSDTNPQTDFVAGSAGYTSKNAYRKFKVTGHVTNQFNREFAKLDSFPADDGVSVTTPLADRPDYHLKITNNNATVRTYKDNSVSPNVGLAVRVIDQEVQLLVLGTGDTDQNDDSVYKLYYKGEESQNLDYASTDSQIAEEINSFSALSGAVAVTPGNSNSKFLITFAKQDGDVAQLTAVTDSGKAVSIHTLENGWSIEAPVSFGFDTMQAGGVVNITAQEVCTFTISGTATNSKFVFCYDGNCGGTPLAGGGANTAARDAIHSILDNNGAAVLSVSVSGSGPYAVTMPLGKSCDGLEMVNVNGLLVHDGTDNALSGKSQVTGIAKSVDKHNNGKAFKITRSFLQSETTTVSALGSTSTVQCPANNCHTATIGIDSLLVTQLPSADTGTETNKCKAIAAETDGDNWPLVRVLSNAVGVTGGTAGVLTFTDILTDTQIDKCVFRLARHVITLDSMPTASALSAKKTLLYTSPVGSCSVAETTKGTYESYECSNRGACDGKSGLCTCFEGYSGQSCQTQTVLV
jgi:hypothetical protein